MRRPGSKLANLKFPCNRFVKDGREVFFQVVDPTLWPYLESRYVDSGSILKIVA